MSDTSEYDARLYSFRAQVEYTRQEAADEELAYWKRRRELLEAEHASAGQKEALANG